MSEEISPEEKAGGGEKRSVTVRIAGEEHTLRSEADPEYTRRCAGYVDEIVREVREAGSGVERHRAVILAALSITDELFRTREEAGETRSDVTRRVRELTRRIEDAVGQG